MNVEQNKQDHHKQEQLKLDKFLHQNEPQRSSGG